MAMSDAMLSNIGMRTSYHWLPSMRHLLYGEMDWTRQWDIWVCWTWVGTWGEADHCSLPGQEFVPCGHLQIEHLVSSLLAFDGLVLIWLGKVVKQRAETDEEGPWVNYSCVRPHWRREQVPVIQNQDGTIIKEAWCITYPGANSDAWWDLPQLLKQIEKALLIFDEAHPGCCALFIFDQSSAHASLRPEALCVFNMNRPNGGKQWRQKDTLILISNPDPHYCRLMQKMTLENGEQKRLQQTLEEHGFDITGMWAKCSLVCPIENEGCCMAHLLSQQEDFQHQTSLLEQTITAWGHLCIFFLKFHWELNLIEMVHIFFSHVQHI